MIYLCGAGCGDTSLLTIKAKRCLEMADCILYDRLIDPSLLAYAKASCEMIYVGKRMSHHAVPQHQINSLLIEKGKLYKYVVRLKGGDPYVFGRGGEEALALYEAGLSFEIVPGIPSGIGGLAYAGIPVTHRDYAGGFRMISAHNKKDELADIDFAGMANTRDTLVFLMGLTSLTNIVEGLLQAGKAGTTPIALVSNASMKNQQTIVSTLQDMLYVDRSMISSPAIIVVGEVVQLHDKLNFIEKKPLYQKRYALPLLNKSVSLVKDELEEAGASVVHFVCGRMKEHEHALSDIVLTDYQYLILTSRSAIDYFFSQLLRNGKDTRSLAHMKICVIGAQSAKHLKQYGVLADIVPDIADSEHLAELLKTIFTNDTTQKDIQILLPKTAALKQTTDVMACDTDIEYTQKDVLYEALQAYCHVHIVNLYETLAVEYTLDEQPLDGILFSCSFMVHEVMKKVKNWSGYQDIPMYSIGHKTSESLRAYGIKTIIELPQARMSAFVEEIIKESKHV